MNDVVEKENIRIENMIYEFRGQNVIVDYDLAILYQCKNGTKEINQAVNRNPAKFPEKYSWILTDEESLKLLVTKCDQKNIETRGGKYKNPRVFTEQAVAMLATILRTPIAIQTSLAIIDTFVTLRHLIIENRDVYQSLNNINNKLINYENKLLKYDEKFNYLFSKFDSKEQLFLEGQTYSSYRNILEILNTAKKEIIIIDEYADITFLDLIRKVKCKIILITKDSNRLSNIEIEKYNKEYNNLRVIRNNSFHDRFFILDKNDIYLSGSSINSAGEKTFMIINIKNDLVKNTLIKNVEEIIMGNI